MVSFPKLILVLGSPRVMFYKGLTILDYFGVIRGRRG